MNHGNEINCEIDKLNLGETLVPLRQNKRPNFSPHKQELNLKNSAAAWSLTDLMRRTREERIQIAYQNRRNKSMDQFGEFFTGAEHELLEDITHLLDDQLMLQRFLKFALQECEDKVSALKMWSQAFESRNANNCNFNLMTHEIEQELQALHRKQSSHTQDVNLNLEQGLLSAKTAARVCFSQDDPLRFKREVTPFDLTSNPELKAAAESALQRVLKKINHKPSK